ncbi:MAG: hypothetical protein MUF45_16080 [Spirosomaceae bacterium]|jgi:hypothetical protein|nr:hypothetical protein [Spirosomataceae bacterium]
MKNTRKYIGYNKQDLVLPYAKFYDEVIRPVSAQIEKALNQNSEKGLTFEALTLLKDDGYHELENGYVLNPDGSQFVAVHTPMPNVRPEMWDWWFGWHSCEDSRYKLWHPKAHQSAVWADGRDDVAYVNRTSNIEEYIGKKLEKAAIQFKSPLELGFSEVDIADKSKVVYICARIGYVDYPLDFGWLVHQIRKTDDGAEMRSRFWMGGKFIAIRSENFLGKIASKILQKLVKLPEQQAKDLMAHCSEEMNHLAAILPDLYNEFNQNN